jgi:hypothetical protein
MAFTWLVNVIPAASATCWILSRVQRFQRDHGHTTRPSLSISATGRCGGAKRRRNFSELIDKYFARACTCSLSPLFAQPAEVPIDVRIVISSFLADVTVPDT